VPENRRKTGLAGLVQPAHAPEKRGRKCASESRAAEIRVKLLAWKQPPELQRISLRALATEIGTSHQLLSFHLRGLHEWQMKEYGKKTREICDRARAENRAMTQEEQTQCVAYGRASLTALVDSATCEMLRGLRRQIRTGTLSRVHVRIAKLLARRGYREAQEILDAHYQHKKIICQ